MSFFLLPGQCPKETQKGQGAQREDWGQQEIVAVNMGKQKTKAGGKGRSYSMPSLHKTTAGQREDEGEATLEYEQNLRKKTKTGRKQKQGSIGGRKGREKKDEEGGRSGCESSLRL